MQEPICIRDRVTIVGVLNLTPDSFSDGGRFVDRSETADVEGAILAGLDLVREGAHVVDVGGESTRPGAREVPAEAEALRVVPIITALARQLDVPISIDTRKAAVAAAAVEAGATVINDVSGLTWDPAIADVAAESGAALVIGHLRGTPENMQDAPHFSEVLAEVADELEDSVHRACRAGVVRERIVVDPGLGFGKRLEDNLQLMAHVGWLRDRLALPVMLGPSRKSFLGAMTGDPVELRDTATHAVCAVAAFEGVDAVRVHDVAGAARAVRVGRALRDARRKELS